MSCNSGYKASRGQEAASSSETRATVPTIEQQPVCESENWSSPPGCCADGRSCDELCIKVIASYECQKAYTIAENHEGRRSDSCCSDKVAAVDQAKREVTIVESGKECRNICCTQDLPKSSENSLTIKAEGHGDHLQQTPKNSNTKQPIKEKDCDAACGSSCCANETTDDKCPDGQPESLRQDSCCANEPDPGPGAIPLGGHYGKPQEPSTESTCAIKDSSESKRISEVAEDHCFDECCSHNQNKNEPPSNSTDEDECSDGGSGKGGDGPCKSHWESALEKYAAYLDAGLCICRSVLDSKDICCSKERRISAMRNEANTRSSQRPRKHPPLDSKDKGKSTAINSLPDIMASTSRTSGRLDKDSKHDVVEGSLDPERGDRVDSSRVSINVSGMTCTGCAKKGMNVMSRIPGVSSPRINFITSSADFDIDSKVQLRTVISRFENETGFKCSQIVQNRQLLDVVLSKSEAKDLEDRLPAGVDSISKVDANVYSLKFDPLVIGARDLLRYVPSQKLAPPRNDSKVANEVARLRQMAWRTALAAILTIPVVVLAWAHVPVPDSTRSIVSLVLATLVQTIAVPEFYVGALKSAIFSRVVEMDMLVVISISAAYGYSIIAFALTHSGYILEQKEFFETSTLLITLVLVGRLVSVVARMRAINAVSMKSLQAAAALLVNDYGDSTTVDARLLGYGDRILVLPHTRIPTDGEIVSGSGSVDESMITGESTPVSKTYGDRVIAGTMNQSFPLTILLSRLPGKNSITDIADLVESALNTKPRTQEMADKLAGWFVPTVIIISIIVFAIWLPIAYKVRDKDGGGGVGLAITYSIAVLAISCPCALGLAVPMVLIISGGVAAKLGIIIKHATATETSYRTTDVVFDKTGTLTTGILEVTEEYYASSLLSQTSKAIVVALVTSNEHPVSSAVAQSLKENKASEGVKAIQSIPGAGVQALWKEMTVKAGNPQWLGVESHPEIQKLIEGGMTIMGVTIESELIAAYGLKSALRPEAVMVVRHLLRRDITCHIVSGDGSQVVNDVAQTVGIEQSNTSSHQIPASKQEYVRRLIDQGKTVLFCGDGTNDAVAIAQAHIGVQIGSTSDMTRASADVVINGGLDGIVTLLEISKQAAMRIYFNFAWAGVYNFFAILLAAGAFVKVRIPPAYAGLGEIVSVLPVILVALSLMRFRRSAVRTLEL